MFNPRELSVRIALQKHVSTVGREDKINGAKIELIAANQRHAPLGDIPWQRCLSIGNLMTTILPIAPINARTFSGLRVNFSGKQFISNHRDPQLYTLGDIFLEQAGNQAYTFKLL